MATAKLTFEKAKAAAITAVKKDIEKRQKKGYTDSARYLLADLAKLEALSTWPDKSTQLRDVDVKYKAIIMKAHLSVTFTEHKFGVTIDRYSMGSSLDVLYRGPPMAYTAIRRFETLYADSGKTELQSDYDDYDNHCSICHEDRPGVSGPMADTGSMVVKA